MEDKLNQSLTVKTLRMEAKTTPIRRKMTPNEAVRKFCIECVGSPNAVKECGGHQCKNGGCDDQSVCWFYPYRIRRGRPPVKLIRKYCLWCMGGETQLVSECWITGCPLWCFRLGKNPAFSQQTRVKRRELARSQALGRKVKHGDGVSRQKTEVK